QHILDDGIRPSAMMNDLVEIALQCVGQFLNFSAGLIVERYALQCVSQFIDQFGRDPREIIHEIERVLDLVRDTGSQLTKQGKFLCLYETILRRAKVFK